MSSKDSQPHAHAHAHAHARAHSHTKQQQQHVRRAHLPSPPASTCSAPEPEFDSGIADADDPWYQPRLSVFVLGPGAGAGLGSGSGSREGRRLTAGVDQALDLDLDGGGARILGMEESWRAADGKRGVVGSGAGAGAGAGSSDVSDVEEEPVVVDKVLLKMDEAGEKRVQPPGRETGTGRGKGREVTSLHVLARLMDTSKGRDKVLKCFQYSFRTYLYLLTIVSRVRPLSPWFKSNRKRVNLAVSGLSLTRKCLLLLNPLHPITDLLSPEPMAARTLMIHLVELFSALSDDVYCLSKLGLVSKRTGTVADRWSNRFWLLTTLVGLYKLHVHTLPRLRAGPSPTPAAGLSEAGWTKRKLYADLAFVSYDVFELQWGVLGEPLKCAAGLAAALISTAKLYGQQWDASVGKG